MMIGDMSVKPIFHCNAKPLALGPRVGLDHQHDAFTLPIPTFFLFFFLIVCFTRYFVFSMAVLPHSHGVVYYHLLLRR